MHNEIKSIMIIGIFAILFSCKNKSTENSYNPITNEQRVSEPIDNNNDYEYNHNQTQNIHSKDVNEEIVNKDCSDTHSSADDAYTYARRAYNADDYDEVKSYLKKAMNSFEDAMSKAEECKCDNAYSSADDGYTYAKRGYNSDDFEEMKDYARKAKNSADDVMSEADDCTNN